MVAWLVPAWSVVWSCVLGSFAVPVMSRVGRSIGGTLAIMMSETEISSTECTAVQDYGFTVRLGNPAWALLCPVWLWDVVGVVWLHCSCGLSAEQVGLPARRSTEGTVNLLVIPTVLVWSGRYDLSGNVVM